MFISRKSSKNSHKMNVEIIKQGVSLVFSLVQRRSLGAFRRPAARAKAVLRHVGVEAASGWGRGGWSRLFFKAEMLGVLFFLIG